MGRMGKDETGEAMTGKTGHDNEHGFYSSAMGNLQKS